MTQQNEEKFALCIRVDECDDLELRKVYQVISDKRAEKDGFLRIVDESGEDYLYPVTYFVLISLPVKAQQALATAV
jgi:hypothetical protein